MKQQAALSLCASLLVSGFVVTVPARSTRADRPADRAERLAALAPLEAPTIAPLAIPAVPRRLASSAEKVTPTLALPDGAGPIRRTNPILPVGEPRPLADDGAASKSLVGASALSAASADFDEDGMPDLVTGYAASDGATLVLHRGNPDALFPNAPVAREHKQNGTFTDEPFLPEVRSFAAPAPPELLAAGDFNADGHEDAVVARRGETALHLLAGDGTGRLVPSDTIALPGAVTALAVGDVNRRDGLPDLLVGVTSPSGARLLVYEWPEGALRGAPESFSLPAPAAAVAVGNLDGDWSVDVAVAAGRDLVVIGGRDRYLSLDPSTRPAVEDATVTSRRMPAAIASLEVGELSGDARDDVALLGVDGSVRILRQNARGRLKSWAADEAAHVGFSPGASLVRAKVSDATADDLVVVDPAGPLQMLVGADAPSGDLSRKRWAEHALPGANAIMAAVPMRLNADAFSDLVILPRGGTVPLVAPTKTASTFTVSTLADNGNNTTPTAGSLRQAILLANGTAGSDTINFTTGLTGTITVPANLPDVLEAAVIDGTGANVQLVDGGPPVFGLRLNATGITVRGLTISSFDTLGGIFVSAGGSHFIEGNRLGTDPTGTTAAGNSYGVRNFQSNNNTIGGTVAAARNIISGNTVGVVSVDGSTTGLAIKGNYIGVSASGTAALANSSDGIQISDSNTTVGGTSAGARNVISGNGRVGIYFSGTSTSELIQANYIGVDATGAAALGNAFGGVRIEGPTNTVGGTAAGAGNVISANTTFPGVYLTGAGATGNTVQGNRIGTDSTGTAALGGALAGVYIEGANNAVGGSAAGAGNLVSGNSMVGIAIVTGATGNTVQGNLIGTDVMGSTALGNVDGIQIGGPSNSVGGSAAGARNVISGNTREGIFVTAATASGNTIKGNLVGVTADGTTALGNGDGGIVSFGANTVVGGSATGEGNVSSGNVAQGIRLSGGATGSSAQGNRVGTDATGTAALGNGTYGILVDAANTTIGGGAAGAGNLVSGNTIGVAVAGASGAVIKGNRVGTNASGAMAIANSGDGILLVTATNATVGGSGAGEGNLVSGNGAYGIHPSGSSSLTIQGNFVGTDATGTAALPNVLDGITADSCSSLIIGGSGAGEGNLISGNGRLGILFVSTSSCTIKGNKIGTDAAGSTALGNANAGVGIIGSDNVIGGTAAGEGNIIANSGFAGVDIGAGTGNAIRGNAIFSNSGLGIDLNDNDVVDANDPGDGDAGANNTQNYPVVDVTSVGGGMTNLAVTLNSTPNTTFSVDMFASSSCDTLGAGEGEVYVGTQSLTTDGSGNGSFVFSFSTRAGKPLITATATDPSNNTSELSLDTPGPISGPVGVNRNTTVAYSVTSPVEGSTFSWSGPAGSSVTSGQGTRSASVLFGLSTGNVQVTVGTLCGSTQVTKLVQVFFDDEFNDGVNPLTRGWTNDVPSRSSWALDGAGNFKTGPASSAGWGSVSYVSNDTDFEYEVSFARSGNCTTCSTAVVVRGVPSPTQTVLNRWNSGYLIGITRDGRYSISKLNGSPAPTTIQPWTSTSPAVVNSAAGATNIVRIIATGATLRVVINHVEVAAMPTDGTASPFLSGQVGIGISWPLNGLAETLKVDYAKTAASLGLFKARAYTPMSREQEKLNREAREEFARHPERFGTVEQAPER